MRSTLALIALLALAACNPPSPASSEPRAVEPTDEDEVAEADDEEAPEVDEPADEPEAAHGAADDDAWMTWEEGSALAEAEDRPMLLFVYADWCARCRELAPVFETDEVRDAAEGLVMVRHNSDDPSPWLRNDVGDHETYVPRVLFLEPDGDMTDLVSPHPRYPLFYTPSMVETLVANMRTHTGG